MPTRDLSRAARLAPSVTRTANIYFPLTSFNSGNTIDVNDTANGAGQHAFVELATNDGNTDYNALELSLQRQMSHRLMYNSATHGHITWQTL